MLDLLDDPAEAKRTTLWYNIMGYRFFKWQKLVINIQSSAGTTPNGQYIAFFTPDATQGWEPDVNYNAHASQSPKSVDGSLFKSLTMSLNSHELEQSTVQRFFKKDITSPLTVPSADPTESITAFTPGQLVCVCVVPPTGIEGDLEYSVNFDMKLSMHGAMPEPRELEQSGTQWITEMNGITKTFDTGAGRDYDNGYFCVNTDIETADKWCVTMGMWDRATNPWFQDVLKEALVCHDDLWSVNYDGFREPISINEIDKGYDCFVLDDPLSCEISVNSNVDLGGDDVVTRRMCHYVIRAKTNGKDTRNPIDKEFCIFCDEAGMPFHHIYLYGPRVRVRLFAEAKVLYGSVVNIPPRGFDTTTFASRMLKAKKKNFSRLAVHPQLVSAKARSATNTQARLKTIIDTPANGNFADLISATSKNSDAILAGIEAIAGAVVVPAVRTAEAT